MKDLADAISVSKQLIGQIEKGKRAISDDVLNKLVEYFGLNLQLPSITAITNDYRSFLTKDTMDNIEVSKIKIIKLKKESQEIEREDIDPKTGETHIRLYNTLDVTGYIKERYNLRKAKFLKIIEDRLASIIDSSIKERGEDNEFESLQDALFEATDKLDLYGQIIDLDAKVDNPYILQKIVRALSIVTSGGDNSDAFTEKLVMLIKDELKRGRILETYGQR